MPEPNMSLCQLSLMDTTLEDDVALAVAAGVSGLGLIEAKLDDDAERDRRRLKDSGLAATVCALDTLSILPPTRQDWYPGVRDLDQRVEDMLAGVDRLGAFAPDTIFCLTGPAGDLPEREARARVVDTLRTLADAAAALGTRIGIETMRETLRPHWTLVCSLDDVIALIEDVDRGNVGIVFDTWHMWDSPRVHEAIPAVVERIYGVQISDYRDPPRGSQDRLLAGDGVAQMDVLLRELREAGYDGWYDMELFSDDGRFGNHYPDSLWKLPREEFAVRQVESFRRCWAASEAQM